MLIMVKSDKKACSTGSTDKKQNKGQFVKGDKRINRAGRTSNFDALRELGKAIGDEVIKATSPGNITRTERILREWAKSKEFQKQKAFLEIAYGKVPDKHEFDGDFILIPAAPKKNNGETN
jgi:hypothetical protein